MATSRRRARACLVLALAVVAAACRQDMHDQPKYTALQASSFFPDNRSARQPVAGTVARGELREDAWLYTGKVGSEPATELPFPTTPELLARGHEMYDAYCSHCHGLTGAGDGMVVQRGFSKPPALYDERVTGAPVGHLFDVITNGFGAMPDHAAQVAVRDRWAIAAYVRTLGAPSTGAASPSR